MDRTASLSHYLHDNGATKPPVLRVLLYEDCAEDIELILRALKADGFEVVPDIAVTLEEVLERAHSVRYDVILSDYRMPCINGMECFTALREHGIDLPFILVTGSLGEEKAVECLREGLADYVLKDRLARLPLAIRRTLAEKCFDAERVRAAEVLRQSEASYRSLMENAPCGILRLDARSGRLLEANQALAEMLGYASPDDLLLQSGNGGIALEASVLARLREGSPKHRQRVTCEAEWPDSRGNPVIVELKGRLLRDENGAPDCLEMIAENVTERRLAQNRISQLNRLYSVLSHAGQAIVHIRNREELFRQICRIVVEEGGFRMAWVGAIAADSPRVTPIACWGAGAEYLQDLFITTTLKPAGSGPTGTAIRESRRVISNDVLSDPDCAPWHDLAIERNYRSAAAFPISAGTGTIGALAIYASQAEFFDHENIALLDELAANLSFACEGIAVEQAHERAVDELNQFFALPLNLLWISDFENYIYRLNPAWEQVLGFSGRELCGKQWVEFVHPEDQPQALAAAAGFALGKPVHRLELRFLTKDGSCRWLLFNGTPSLSHGLVFAAASDITERKLLEEQLRSQNLALEEQNRALQEANRMKSEFLANMSHELRSPLNGIIGFTELLHDGKLGALAEGMRDYLGRILKSSRHLLQLINGVLDLSKVEAGRLELYPEPVELAGLIGEVLSVQSALAAQKKIRISAEIDPRAHRAVTDASRFKQILHNYLSNALKFTGEGGRVTVRLQKEGADDFRLEVSDTGIGIAPQDLSRLFTEFQQLDSSASKRYQGTGLGLALTKRIVEAQGGRVGVRSIPGEGSAFFAVLPQTFPASEPDAAGVREKESVT
jgi:PAS domain S-box-containing protein